MKRMGFFAGQGAKRRHSGLYGNDEQRSHLEKDAFSWHCFDETDYQNSLRLFGPNGRQVLDPWAHQMWMVLKIAVIAKDGRNCRELGRITPANEVDHIDANPRNNECSNLQGLCKSCHITTDLLKVLRILGANGMHGSHLGAP